MAGKDLESNVLIVVQGEHPLLYSNRLETRGVNWIGKPLDEIETGKPLHCVAKLRYRQPDQACCLTPVTHDRWLVSFEKAQRAVAPGQYAVFYDGERCLGGAVIETVVAAENCLRKTG